MALAKLDHYSIRTPRLDETRRFYAEVMGMHEGPRPPFPFPGAWMYVGDTAMVHLVGYDPNDAAGLKQYLGDKPLADGGTGTIDHVAFVARDLPALKARLDGAGCAYRERTVPSLDLHQLFVEDPNGVTLELNFPGSEAPPP
jgi:catechol 2,3-dioxygenase-like lactoylglutathione lyase family enzyme